MLVVISFTYSSDLIYISNAYNDNLKKLQKQFDKWIYNKTIDHGYWIYKNGRKYGVSYGTDAFVEWLNENVFSDSDEKAKIVEKCILNVPTGLNKLYF